MSFSLRNCMFATLHVALTTARKDCRSLSHRCTRPYVHPRQTLNSSTARSGSRGSGAPLGRRSAALTRDSRPVHCALRAGSLGRIYPRAALDEHLLLEPAVCSARLADSSHLPRRDRISPVENPRRRCAHVWKMRLSSRSWHWCAASRRGAELAAPDEGSNHWSSVDISGRGITRGRGAEPAAPAQPSCITSALRRATSLTTSD